MRSTFVTLIPGSVVAGDMAGQVASVGPDELATLKHLALEGGLEGTQVTCASLADRLDASNQTASRRLQRLEDAGLLEREVLGDGQRVRLTDEGERALRREYEQYRRVFEREERVTLAGTVTSGMGEGRHYISLSGYMEQFREKLGYEPFAGTLNIDLDEAGVERRARMDAMDPVRIEGWEDEERTYGPAFCWPAAIAAREAAASDGANGDDGQPGGDGRRYEGAHVIAPERTHHGADQLEVIAPDKLRDALDLEDGSEVSVDVAEQ